MPTHSQTGKPAHADDVVIVAARRTPIGSFLGGLAGMSATDLGAAAVKAVVTNTDLPLSDIDEAYMGCVLPAGLGQAPARQAALKAGLPISVGCTTVNKVCGSGMKAVMLANDAIRVGSARVVVAGGMESMSNAPYLVTKVRSGYRFGHQTMIDHMFYDGLENAADNQLMGHFAERCARNFTFTRQEQDAYAVSSVQRAIAAINDHAFDEEIVPLEVAEKGAVQLVDQDEQPFKCKIDKIAQLKPAFDRERGTVTAANSSSLSDGAAALLLTTRTCAQKYKLPVLARLVGHASHAQAPEDFTTAPVGAIKRLMATTGWTLNGVDLFEINEAFAVVTMAAMRELGIDRDKTNVNGGACALGHPIGATGARLLVTLIYALRHRGLKRGVASLCIGGGEATAVALELE